MCVNTGTVLGPEPAEGLLDAGQSGPNWRRKHGSQVRPQQTRFPGPSRLSLGKLGQEEDAASKPTLGCPLSATGLCWGLAEALRFAPAKKRKHAQASPASHRETLCPCQEILPLEKMEKSQLLVSVVLEGRTRLRDCGALGSTWEKAEGREQSCPQQQEQMDTVHPVGGSQHNSLELGRQGLCLS